MSNKPDDDVAVSSHKEYAEKGLGPNSEASRALDLARENGDLSWTAAEEKKLLLKLDFIIVPLAFLSGIFAFADSGAYGIAAIFGMVVDLKLYDVVSYPPLVVSLTKYSWTSSIPTFGTLVTLIPILIIAQRLPLGKVYSATVIWSGIFALLMLAVHDFRSTMIVRCLYGIQGALISIFLIYISSWYTQQEQPLRIGLVSTGSAFGSLVGQGIDLGAINIGGGYATQPWRWMYVIIGSITLVIGFLDMVILPDTPTKAFFFTKREKAILIERVRRNGTGMQSSKFDLKKAFLALKDPQVWFLTYLAFVIQFGNSALGSFGGLITSSFGYAPKDALKLLMPVSGLAIVVLATSGAMASYFPRTRIYIAIASFVITVAGDIILWKSPRNNKGALLCGLYLSSFFFGAYVQLQSLVTSNIGGSTKKTAATGVIFIFSSAGAIVAPFAYKSQEAARGYPTGVITSMSLMIGGIVTLICLRLENSFYYTRYNNKAAAAAGVEQQSDPVLGFADVDEREVAYFRYKY